MHDCIKQAPYAARLPFVATRLLGYFLQFLHRTNLYYWLKNRNCSKFYSTYAVYIEFYPTIVLENSYVMSNLV